MLDWDELRVSPDPHQTALDFARAATRIACTMCDWDSTLASSVEGKPPPLS